jgi:cytochrome P450
MRCPRELNFLQPQILSNPFGFFPEALDLHPVIKIPGQDMYVVFSRELVAEVLDRPDDFSNNFAAFLEGRQAEDSDIKAVMSQGYPFVDTLLTADPPAHAHYRRLVNLAFSGPRVNAMEATIRAIAARLLDAFGARGECDFAREFAIPFPVEVISRWIGLGTIPPDRVRRWSEAMADRVGGLCGKERELQCAREVVEFQHAMMSLIQDRRKHREDDFLSDLLEARIEGERQLTDLEVLSILQQIIPAGNDTSTVAIIRGLLLLIRYPDVARAVREDGRRVANMVEEMMRFESPAQGIYRITRHATTLGGYDIPGGAMVLVSVGSVGRDPKAFPQPETFDINRKNAPTHFGFGRGIHGCLGMMLARKEMTIAYEQILGRMDDIKVADGAKLYFSPSMTVPTMPSLPIVFKWRGQTRSPEGDASLHSRH